MELVLGIILLIIKLICKIIFILIMKMKPNSPEYRDLVTNLLGKPVKFTEIEPYPSSLRKNKVDLLVEHNKVFVAIYVLSDDSDEPQVKVFARKESAIRYVENEIRRYEGQEDFQIDETDEDMIWDLDYGVHWEISEQEIN